MIDDRSLIAPYQLVALRPALRSPTVYIQRLVERLDFLTHGGQRWRRDLQILIPEVEDLSKAEDHWFIVSLGIFARRRFPDFRVVDCNGRALNLLTRVQHGHCLAGLTVDQHLTESERSLVDLEVEKNARGDVARAYGKLYETAFKMFTTVDTEVSPTVKAGLQDLLKGLGAGDGEAERRADLIFEDMGQLSRVTQYLCWVRGRPGSAVRLTASYTMPDPAKLADWRQAKLEMPDPADGEGQAPSRPVAKAARVVRSRFSRFYAGLGLGPLPYYVNAAANDHAASYYFTIEPPPESGVAYLDWGLSNSIEEDDEITCAHASVHIHNGAGLRVAGGPARLRTQIPGGKIFAFIRSDPADNKQVVFAAALNVVIVWLAEAGRLSSQFNGLPSPWLAFIPAVLLAYVTQQRQHYFASVTKWIRVVLWAYLALNIIFLVSITFNVASDGSFADRHGASDDAVSIAMAGASIAVICLFVFLGRPYTWFVHHGVRLLNRCENWKLLRRKRPRRPVYAYVKVARWYGHVTMATIVVALSLMVAFLVTGHGPDGESRPPAKAKERAGVAATNDRSR